MSEEATPTTEDHSKELRAAWDDFQRNHKHATEEQLTAFKREFESMIHRMTDEDKREREKLAADLKEIKDAMDAERKTRDEKERSEGGSGTIVVPPSEVPPTSGSEGNAGKSADTSDNAGASRRKGWRAWV